MCPKEKVEKVVVIVEKAEKPKEVSGKACELARASFVLWGRWNRAYVRQVYVQMCSICARAHTRARGHVHARLCATTETGQ